LNEGSEKTLELKISSLRKIGRQRSWGSLKRRRSERGYFLTEVGAEAEGEYLNPSTSIRQVEVAEVGIQVSLNMVDASAEPREEALVGAGER